MKKNLLSSGVLGLVVNLWATAAFAAESSGPTWRPTYDRIMLYVNFLILAFAIYRYIRPLLMNFLHGRQDAMARELKQMETEKDKMLAKVQETVKTLNESEIRLAELRKKITELGESRKKEIVEDANKQSRIMLEMTKQKIQGQIIRAKETVKSELVDAAIDLAMEILPHNITSEDNQLFIERYLTTAGQVRL